MELSCSSQPKRTANGEDAFVVIDFCFWSRRTKDKRQPGCRQVISDKSVPKRGSENAFFAVQAKFRGVCNDRNATKTRRGEVSLGKTGQLACSHCTSQSNFRRKKNSPDYFCIDSISATGDRKEKKCCAEIVTVV
jgi:hypothetical protein